MDPSRASFSPVYVRSITAVGRSGGASSRFHSHCMLRDRLVCGIKDSRVQRRLLSETDLTFKKAFELAQASEVAEKNARDLHKPTGAVHAIRTQQPPKKIHRAIVALVRVLNKILFKILLVVQLLQIHRPEEALNIQSELIFVNGMLHLPHE